ncbi:hypothetical protein BC938DRAFT_471795 [Jimgerdemannia flammicorona]|uniref:Uncharacterized protein n=1 Tax=Jimgerdemannia flammicorona TaxID=994334 RepID=A0A433QUF0_9FUNG|nr:hypothetical protein BC938DRAFT_471795 [Jimgerdemannia flammicorona]
MSGNFGPVMPSGPETRLPYCTQLCTANLQIMEYCSLSQSQPTHSPACRFSFSTLTAPRTASLIWHGMPPTRRVQRVTRTPRVEEQERCKKSRGRLSLRMTAWMEAGNNEVGGDDGNEEKSRKGVVVEEGCGCNRGWGGS